MFAMLISQDNLSEIIKTVPEADTDRSPIDLFLNHKKNWYIITGYVDRHGRVHDWVILPEIIVHEYFEFGSQIQDGWYHFYRK